jgi:hypothetical protein
MKKKKLTPIEVLQKQKAALQSKSDKLTETIEDRVKYLQSQMGTLVRDSLLESAVSVIPNQLRDLAGRFFYKSHLSGTQSNSTSCSVFQGIALSIAEFAPFFIRGKRGAIFSLLLRQLLKMFIR